MRVEADAAQSRQLTQLLVQRRDFAGQVARLEVVKLVSEDEQAPLPVVEALVGEVLQRQETVGRDHFDEVDVEAALRNPGPPVLSELEFQDQELLLGEKVDFRVNDSFREHFADVVQSDCSGDARNLVGQPRALWALVGSDSAHFLRKNGSSRPR